MTRPDVDHGGMKRLLLVLAATVGIAAMLPMLPAQGAAPQGVAIVGTPSGNGSWVAFSDGHVAAEGDAVAAGTASGRRLNAPIVAMAGSPTGRGYWLAARDGGVFAFGDAPFRGSAGGIRLNRPIVAMASTSTGLGYWLVASDGGVFSYGDARYRGGLGARRLNRPIVGAAATPTGQGYWLVASDGGVFAFGDARFLGGTGDRPPTAPVVGMAATGSGQGYWLLTSAGAVFAFGDAPYDGGTGGAVAIGRVGAGYRTLSADGTRQLPGPSFAACRTFPLDNPWNTDISRLPVHHRSAAWVASIGTGRNLHPDFGTIYGIPFVEVGSAQRRVPISFEYADESDHGPYPIPPDAPIEGGGDRHILVVDKQSCQLWEVFAAETSDGGRSWRAGSGAHFDLTSNALRPDGWTSADAGGLPIYPGLVRYDEVAAGEIAHALRFTVRRSQRGYIHPATHFASSITDLDVPPMGARFRMKAGYDCSPFSREVQVLCRALKRFGMFVADNGSDWFITGAPDRRWDDDAIGDLKRIPGSAFEAVDTGPIHR